MKKIARLLAVVVLMFNAPARAEDWKYDAALYGWLTGLEGTVGIGNAVQQPVSASFSELLEYVDFAMAAHFEAKNPRVVLVSDVAYFNLGAERDATVLKQDVTIDLDMNEYVIELGGGYRVTPEFDLLLAGRWYVFEFGAQTASEFGASSSSATYDWGDIFAGARYTKAFDERWVGSVRADIGTGGSEFAWFGNVALAYRFNDLVSAGIAWRLLSLDREPDISDGDYFLYDVTQSGLGIGVGFSF